MLGSAVKWITIFWNFPVGGNVRRWGRNRGCHDGVGKLEFKISQEFSCICEWNEIEIFWCFFVNLYFWTYDISLRTFCSLPLSRKVNMTQNWLKTIFCGIYNFSSENGAAFSQNWLINISVRYVATIIQVSSEIPPLFHFS